MTESLRIGFAGLGQMGALIAQRLLSAGHALHVYNRTPDKAAPFVERGATHCATPAELAHRTDVIFLCLFDDKAIESVLFAPGGIADAANPRHLIADLSTTHPDFARGICSRLRDELGMAWVDAPVSGGPAGAAQGTLAVMAGGSQQDVDRLRPLFAAFSSQVTHVGTAGFGQLAKACNQMINFGNAVAIAEAMHLAARSGLDPRVFPHALAGGFSDSALLRNLGPGMAQGLFRGNSRMTMKDLEIALDLGRSTGSAMPVTALVGGFFRILAARGHLNDGIGGIAKFYSDIPLSELAETSAAGKWLAT